MITGKRQWILSAGLLLALNTQTASAGLMNTDFSSGYSGWSGEVISYNYLSGMDSTETGNIFNQFGDNFLLSGNEVTLTTSSDAMNDYWSVSMFQEATLAEDIQTLALTVEASLTDPAADFFYVQLRDLTTDNVIDLSAGGLFDISTWAGQSVSFEFGVMDFDFIPADSIAVGDISLGYASVPAPATGLLLALGALISLRRKGC